MKATPAQTKSTPPIPFRARAGQFWRKEIRPLLILALILFSIRSSLADWNDVPSGSMRPTILEGDRIFVNKLAYDLKVPFTTWHIAEWSNPQRGDIVVFFSPHDGTRLVKRIIGLPGDTIELRNNQLVLNGTPVEYQPIAEELLRYIPAAERAGRVFASEKLPGQTHAVGGYPTTPAPRTFAPIIVPQGEYFMMGDNRDDSFDSRFYGPVKREKIVGCATAVVLSFRQEPLLVAALATVVHFIAKRIAQVIWMARSAAGLSATSQGRDGD